MIRSKILCAISVFRDNPLFATYWLSVISLRRGNAKEVHNIIYIRKLYSNDEGVNTVTTVK